MMAPSVCIAAAAMFAVAAAVQRTDVDISFGWRFSLGHRSCSTYPISLNDQQVRARSLKKACLSLVITRASFSPDDRCLASRK